MATAATLVGRPKLHTTSILLRVSENGVERGSCEVLDLPEGEAGAEANRKGANEQRELREIQIASTDDAED